MQVNLLQHLDAFPNLEAAFDPAANVAYAVRFLQGLHEQTGDWAKAAALYHSATPSIGAEYERKVLAAWPDEQRLASASPSSPAPSPIARAWAASLGGSPFGVAGGAAWVFGPSDRGGGTLHPGRGIRRGGTAGGPRPCLLPRHAGDAGLPAARAAHRPALSEGQRGSCVPGGTLGRSQRAGVAASTAA